MRRQLLRGACFSGFTDQIMALLRACPPHSWRMPPSSKQLLTPIPLILTNHTDTMLRSSSAAAAAHHSFLLSLLPPHAHPQHHSLLLAAALCCSTAAAALQRLVLPPLPTHRHSCSCSGSTTSSTLQQQRRAFSSSPSSSQSSSSSSDSSSIEGRIGADPEAVADMLEANIYHPTREERHQARQESRLRLLTTRREALSLYREVLRYSNLFVWRDEHGRVWRDVIRASARQEFEAARREPDPELINRMIVTGRDAVHRTVEGFLRQRERIVQEEASKPQVPPM